MKRYKLTTQDMTTHNDHKWEIGVKQVIDKHGNTLCSNQVFHFYDSPEIAVLLNPSHANIKNHRLWEVECDEVVHDGTKGGAKRMKLVKKVEAPVFSLLQKRVFAIKCALAVYKNKDFERWATNFLSGKNRSATDANATGADAATYATYATGAAYAAGAAAANAADSVVYTSDDVAYTAAYAAVSAATYAAGGNRKMIKSAAKFAANFRG